MREEEVDGAVERVHHPGETAGPLRTSPLLAKDAVGRPQARELVADQALGGEIGLADKIGGRALAFQRLLAPALEAPEQQCACVAGQIDSQREQIVDVRAQTCRLLQPLAGTLCAPASLSIGHTAHANASGRCCAQGRSASSWPASESSVVSAPGRPTICTPRGRPSEPKPAGTEAAGWPVRFQGAL